MSRPASVSSQGSQSPFKRIGGRTFQSGECKYEKALRLAEARLLRDARNPASKLEVELRARALEAEQQAKENFRQEWLESFSTERAEVYEDRMRVIRGRREGAQVHQRSQSEQLIADAAAKQQADQARAEALAQLRADEEALLRDDGIARDQKIQATVSKATDILRSQQEERMRQQEDLARRRREVEEGLARERAESVRARRTREEDSSSRLRARSAQLDHERHEKEARFQRKIQQVESEKQRRNEIMDKIKSLQMEGQSKAQQFRDMAWQAAVCNTHVDLRQELEALVPRLANLPTTPRSLAGGTADSFGVASPRRSIGGRGGSSQQTSSRGAMAGTPRKYVATASVSVKALSLSLGGKTSALKGQAEQKTPTSGCTPCSSRSSIGIGSGAGKTGYPVSSPLRRKSGGRHVQSSVSIGSTRSSLQASAADLEDEPSSRVSGG